MKRCILCPPFRGQGLEVWPICRRRSSETKDIALGDMGTSQRRVCFDDLKRPFSSSMEKERILRRPRRHAHVHGLPGWVLPTSKSFPFSWLDWPVRHAGRTSSLETPASESSRRFQ